MQEVTESLRVGCIGRQGLEAVDRDHAWPTLSDQRPDACEDGVEATLVEHLSQVVEEDTGADRLRVEEVKPLPIAQDLL